MTEFHIAGLPCGGGQLGLCPIPGRNNDYAGDLAAVLDWSPALVLSMTETSEFARVGATGFGDDLKKQGIQWQALPIRDFGAPTGQTLDLWPDASQRARMLLSQGRRVLVHCFGGCGRSGMVILRLMIELGEPAPAALARLRATRPCAVETEAQRLWATAPRS